MSTTLQSIGMRKVGRAGSSTPLVVMAAHVLILAVIWFNFILCIVNARQWFPVSGALVACIQVALLAAAAYLGRTFFSTIQAAYAVIVLLTVFALKIANPAIDLKILFDLAVAPIFLVLGLHCTVAQTHRILANVLLCVVTVGCIEMMFPTWYEGMTNIWSYYVSKGSVSEATTNFTGTTFFVSGQRSEQAGRTLLGWLLGPHRASSLFLEPVSMGNLPIVCLAWLLCVRLPDFRLSALLFILTFATIILPDSRYSSACCALMLLFRQTGLHRSSVVAALLPVVVLIGLWTAGSVTISPGELPRIFSDDLGGRLLFSGKLLAYWTATDWFGLSASPIYVADTGYAYLISNVGLPVAIAIWLGFAFAPVRSEAAAGMRGMIAIYYTTSLAINGSSFSIKTAALLWFLYGAAQLAPPSAGLGMTRRDSQPSMPAKLPA